MNILAFIPARSGSETVGMKNMLRLGDEPLVGWVLRAACENDSFGRVVVSTDHEKIREYCESNYPEATVVERPKHLCGSDVAVNRVVVEYLRDLEKHNRPHAVALFQPTSPFVRQYQIEELVIKLKNPLVHSAYTITKVPHNYHWINQREKDEDRVRFLFPGKRAIAWNKQKKEPTYKFGNLVITRTQFIKTGFFIEPSAHLEIDRFDAADIDDQTDFEVARTMVEAGYWENGDR